MKFPPVFCFGLLLPLALAIGQVPETPHNPNFHEDLNASYDFATQLSASRGSAFVDFSSQYPSEFNAALILEGDTLHQGGSGGDSLSIQVVRVKSHTSNALNLRTNSDDTLAFAEFQFPSSFPAVHMTDIVFLMEAFNLYDSTKFASGKDSIIIDVTLSDPLGSGAPVQVTRKISILDYVRSFRFSTLGSVPVRALIDPPVSAFSLRGGTQPFMDLQFIRFTADELKLRVNKVRVSVPRLKTIVPLAGGTTATVNGGIRLHGIAITTDFNFGSYTPEKPFDLNGPWYSQAAGPTFAPWFDDVINPDDVAGYAFIQKGCWMTSWASIMHAQGATKVEAENSTALVNLTPLTLARYVKKKNLFRTCSDDPGTQVCFPSYNLPELLKGTNGLSGNTKLEFKASQIDASLIEDYLARKIPVLLKVFDHTHFVVANGIETYFKKRENKWVKTYFINDVGYANNFAMVNGEIGDINKQIDWDNKFSYAMFMAPTDKSKTNGLVLQIFSPAQAFIVDPLGRRRGLNPADGISYDEIPDVTATLGEASFTTLPDFPVPPDPDPVKYIHINQPVQGEFQIQIVGTGSGPYTLEIIKIDAFGTETTQLIHGNTVEGQIDPVAVNYKNNENDVIPPVTVSDFVEAPWNRINPLVIHFSATDTGSGVAQTFVKVDGGDAKDTTAITLTEEGEHTVEFWSTDKAGNVEPVHTLLIHNDFTPPVSSHDYTGTGTENGSVTINFQSVDALSGVAAFSLLVNGVAASSPLTLSAAGVYQIEFFGTDVAGNVETPKPLQITISLIQTVVMHLEAKEKKSKDKEPEVHLKWRHTGSGDYRVMRSTLDSTQGFVEIGRTPERKFVDENVDVGAVYYYRIRVDNLQSEAVSVLVEGKEPCSKGSKKGRK